MNNVQVQRFPDFLIVGAMKSGTSSLHAMLDMHPEVYVAQGEQFFFDCDDREQHPDFVFEHSGQLKSFDFDLDFHRLQKWYHSRFSEAAEGQLIGEDSTTYLASTNAMGRIRHYCPNARIIILLRNPVDRAHSHYWHLVRTGRAVYDFETTLIRTPGTLLQRGMYRHQLARVFEHFPQEQVKVLLFEDFRGDPNKHFHDVCRFLGVEPNVTVPLSKTHHNAALVPRILGLRLFANWLNRSDIRRRYATHFELPSAIEKTERRRTRVTFGRVFGRISMIGATTNYPDMKEETRQHLEEYYRRENKGLCTLADLPYREKWGAAAPIDSKK